MIIKLSKSLLDHFSSGKERMQLVPLEKNKQIKTSHVSWTARATLLALGFGQTGLNSVTFLLELK